MLTIAAARAHGRAVFVSPPDKRSEAEAARKALAPAAYAYRSDHLALVAAFAGWEAARRQGGRRAAAEYSMRNFISDQVRRGEEAGEGVCSWLQQLHGAEAGRLTLCPLPHSRSQTLPSQSSRPSPQSMDAIAAGRADFARTLSSLGFLPDW